MRWVLLSLLAINMLLFYKNWGSIGSSEANNRVLNKLDPEPFVNSRRCSLLGPIESARLQDELMTTLAEYRITAKKISKKVPKAPKFWVFIPPAETRSEALAMLRALRERKIDSFIITSKNLNNAISLGVFDNVDIAEKVMNARKAQGYTVRMVARGRYRTQYWLLLDSVSDALKKNTVLADKIQRQEIRDIFCKTVDS